MKNFIKKITPEWVLSLYHYSLALIADLCYGFPSKKMIVIGVTGTKGKTSTANFIWSSLEAGGFKTGIISTANIRIADKQSLNYLHMTMPGRFAIQKLMAEMVKHGCKFCVVETTSEGIKQFRHIGIRYDMAVFTNLTPEHLPSHGGSFEAYKEAKSKLFKVLSTHSKTIDGKRVEKVIIANKDSEHADYYLNHIADKKITYAINSSADYVAAQIVETNSGVDFEINGAKFNLSILGKFNVYNALPAIIISKSFRMNDVAIRKGLLGLQLIPGRMEQINQGQNFTVIVDYAHEKQSITNVLQTAKNMKINSGKPNAKTIILLGAEGGGRDRAKRPIMGELSAKMADYLIVSNVDPYDDDPKDIVEDIAVSAEKFGMVRNNNLFVIEDRGEGIRKALSLAREGDVVLITGKGAEQSMILGNKIIPWDDRKVVREELAMLLKVN
ncbi:MAG: hypothetical protein RL536_380 [Candidatus Parcubacteria bacterium]